MNRQASGVRSKEKEPILAPHPSPLLTLHPSSLTLHFLLFTPYSLPLTPSLFTSYFSRLLGLSGYGHRRPNPTYATSHASRLTPYPSPLTLPYRPRRV